MMIWIAFACLIAAVLAAIVWPLAGKWQVPVDRAAYDRAVYRDQLAELDRDAARGLIGLAEAEAARNEIARRLLAAKDAEPAGAADSGRFAPLAALAFIPVLAIGVYVLFGRPDLPDVPLQQRLEAAAKNQDMAALIAKVEALLVENPTDLQGWAVLASAYKRMERFDDAANAYANILRLTQPSADLYANYAEMLVFANGGLVTADAARGFGEALKLDPKHPRARFFSGLGLKQEGKIAEALAVWRGLLAESAAGAPWRKSLETEIAAAAAPGPTPEQMAAAQAMNAEDRRRMIQTMVDGLEEKLKADGSDIAGWQRLIRARMVLGQRERAKVAYRAARELFKDKPDVLASFEGLAKELGVE